MSLPSARASSLADLATLDRIIITARQLADEVETCCTLDGVPSPLAPTLSPLARAGRVWNATKLLVDLLRPGVNVPADRDPKRILRLPLEGKDRRSVEQMLRHSYEEMGMNPADVETHVRLALFWNDRIHKKPVGPVPRKHWTVYILPLGRWACWPQELHDALRAVNDAACRVAAYFGWYGCLYGTAGRQRRPLRPANRRLVEGLRRAADALEDCTRRSEERLGSGLEDRVDLAQAAALVHLTKRGLENYKRRKNDPLPAPDFPGGGGRKDLWLWSTLRPWMERNFPFKLPEHFLSIKFVPGQG
jgi:hypothetical protein